MLHFTPEAEDNQDPPPDFAQSLHLNANKAIQAGLLATARIRVNARNGVNMQRALLDPGSTNSFITRKAANAMKLHLRPVSIPVSGLQAAPCGQVKHVTTFKATSYFDSSLSFTVTALVVDKISSLIPSESLETKQWYHLHELTLADPEFYIPGPVDILLGADQFWTILGTDKICGDEGHPIAWDSSLGWLVAGPNNTSTPVSVFTINADLRFKTKQRLQVANSQVPVATSQVPVVISQVPVATSQVPVAISQAPVATSQVPVATSQVPVVISQAPVATSQVPVATSQAPIATSQVPVVSSQVPVDLVSSQLHDLLSSQVRDLVSSQVRDLVSSQVRDLVSSQVRDLVSSQGRDLVSSQGRDFVSFQVRDTTSAPLHGTVSTLIQDPANSTAAVVQKQFRFYWNLCNIPLKLIFFPYRMML